MNKIIFYLLLISNLAHADDWGCEVLMCLSNPNGPMAVPQCVPPITRLYEGLSLKHPIPFPSCDFDSGGYGNSWAQQTNTYYELCPNGTQELAIGELAAFQSLVLVGIGSGNDVSSNPDGGMPRKVCVGNLTGTTSIQDQDGNYVTAGIYEPTVVLDASGHSRAIDVYVGGSLYRRVYW